MESRKKLRPVVKPNIKGKFFKGLDLYRSNFWLCAVSTSTNFANANGNGNANTNNASNSNGVRPYFVCSTLSVGSIIIFGTDVENRKGDLILIHCHE